MGGEGEAGTSSGGAAGDQGVAGMAGAEVGGSGGAAGEPSTAGEAGMESMGGAAGTAGEAATAGMAGEAAGHAGAAGAGGEASTGDVNAVATAQPDLAGLPTNLSGVDSSDSEGQDLTYEWTIDSVPEDSEVTSADLDDEFGKETFFGPDLGGTYEVTLTVMNEDGLTDDVTIQVDVPVIAIPFLSIASEADEYTGQPFAVDSDGTNDRAIGCESPMTAESEQDLINAFDDELARHARPYYPVDIEQDTLFVYPSGSDVKGNFAPTPAALYVAGTATDCGVNDPELLELGIVPVFSPDGSRIVYGTGSNDVRVVSPTGTGARTIRPGATLASLAGAGPFWLDGSTVGWLEQAAADSSYFDLWVAHDSSSPGAAVLMTCPDGSEPFFWGREISMSAAGLIATMGPASASPGASIFLLQTDASGDYNCDSVNALNEAIYTVEDTAAQAVLEFEISPDGNTVLFVKLLEGGSTSPSELWTVPAAGGTAALFTNVAGGRQVGPHYIGGGKQIVWTRFTYDDADRPTTIQLWRANADGTNAQVIYEAESTDERAVLLTTGTGSSTCSFGYSGSRQGGLLAGLFGLGLILLARRRPRPRA